VLKCGVLRPQVGIVLAVGLYRKTVSELRQLGKSHPPGMAAGWAVLDCSRITSVVFCWNFKGLYT